MTFSIRIIQFLGFLCIAGAVACGRGGGRSTDSATEDSATEAAEAGERRGETDAMLAQARVSWEGEKAYDLTGDGRPERLTVKAFGPAYDSLTVVLEITDPAGTVLYRDRWGSQRYFAYDYRAGKPDSTVKRIVTTHLKQILADRAFKSAQALGIDSLPDTVTVRYDLAEHRVRALHHLSDTSTLGIAHFDEIEKTTILHDEILKAIANTKHLPRFTYFSGGELTYTLVWSKALGRMVRVFSCC